MICNNCGNIIKDGSAFCSNCGARIQTSNKSEMSINTPISQKSNKRLLIAIAGCLIVMVIFAVAGIFLYQKNVWNKDTEVAKKSTGESNIEESKVNEEVSKNQLTFEGLPEEVISSLNEQFSIFTEAKLDEWYPTKAFFPGYPLKNIIAPSYLYEEFEKYKEFCSTSQKYSVYRGYVDIIDFYGGMNNHNYDNCYIEGIEELRTTIVKSLIDAEYTDNDGNDWDYRYIDSFNVNTEILNGTLEYGDEMNTSQEYACILRVNCSPNYKGVRVKDSKEFSYTGEVQTNDFVVTFVYENEEWYLSGVYPISYAENYNLTLNNSSNSVDWKQIYLNTDFEWNSNDYCALADINGDNVPELFIGHYYNDNYYYYYDIDVYYIVADKFIRKSNFTSYDSTVTYSNGKVYEIRDNLGHKHDDSNSSYMEEVCGFDNIGNFIDISYVDYFDEYNVCHMDIGAGDNFTSCSYEEYKQQIDLNAVEFANANNITLEQVDVYDLISNTTNFDSSSAEEGDNETVTTSDEISIEYEVLPAYEQYVNERSFASEGFSFIYLDDDEIPELVIHGSSEADGNIICTYHNGSVSELQTIRLGFSFLEKQGLLCNSGGNMGEYFDIVYSLEDGQFTKIAEGTWKDDFVDGNQVYECFWNGQQVTDIEYNSALAQVYTGENDVFIDNIKFYSSISEAYENMNKETYCTSMYNIKVFSLSNQRLQVQSVDGEIALDMEVSDDCVWQMRYTDGTVYESSYEQIYHDWAETPKIDTPDFTEEWYESPEGLGVEVKNGKVVAVFSGAS